MSQLNPANHIRFGRKICEIRRISDHAPNVTTFLTRFLSPAFSLAGDFPAAIIFLLRYRAYAYSQRLVSNANRVVLVKVIPPAGVTAT